MHSLTPFIRSLTRSLDEKDFFKIEVEHKDGILNIRARKATHIKHNTRIKIK